MKRKFTILTTIVFGMLGSSIVYAASNGLDSGNTTANSSSFIDEAGHYTETANSTLSNAGGGPTTVIQTPSDSITYGGTSANVTPASPASSNAKTFNSVSNSVVVVGVPSQAAPVKPQPTSSKPKPHTIKCTPGVNCPVSMPRNTGVTVTQTNESEQISMSTTPNSPSPGGGMQVVY